MTDKISLPCTKEKQMGNCSWQYVYKYNAYMCSICGNEFLRPLTREDIEKEQKLKGKN
jgi:DNA-directed RNA polymerase subunit RPC12/RpoP